MPVSHAKPLIILIWVTSLNTFATDKIKVVTDEAVPLQYIANGKVSGKTTRVVEAALKLAKIDAKIEIYPWARSITIAKNEPNTLIYPLIRSAEREKLFQWIGEILVFKLAFVALKSNTAVQLYEINDAKGLRLAVMRNDYTHNVLVRSGFKENIDFKVFSEFTQLLKLLYADKIDTFIADLELLKETARNMGFDEEQLIEAYVIPGQQMSVYLAANNQTDPDIVNALKVSLRSVKKSNN
jgi:polar amino acid transport system substrate-binding protein